MDANAPEYIKFLWRPVMAILAHSAKNKNVIPYKDVAYLLRTQDFTDKTYTRQIGHIAGTGQNYLWENEPNMPPVNAIAVNKGTGLPSLFGKTHGETHLHRYFRHKGYYYNPMADIDEENMDRQQRSQIFKARNEIFEKVKDDVFNYSHWDTILKKLAP
ncbi:hypothetical protein [Yunchengibacter salinarum]|uniref:hypothetical protein n=1 Tax=Yunchengibacter salinarum TaxID=3133399 RepID=UPI0035B65868